MFCTSVGPSLFPTSFFPTSTKKIIQGRSGFTVNVFSWKTLVSGYGKSLGKTISMSAWMETDEMYHLIKDSVVRKMKVRNCGVP